MTDEQEGKSLEELAGEGYIATPETEAELEVRKALDEEIHHDWLEKYQGKSIKELLENTPTSVTAEYDPATKILSIKPSLPTEEEIMKPVDFKDGIFGMRSDIELVKSKVKNWMSHPELKAMGKPVELLSRASEATDNLRLAYRHLEDARMRLGKAIQAYDGGKSCYPR